MMTVNAKKISKQALDYQKGAFACWYDAMSTLQDQAAMAVDLMLSRTSWVPEKDRRALSSWVGICKNERDRYKSYMDESFSILEEHVSQDTMEAPAGRNEPAPDAGTAASVIKSAAEAEGEKEAPGAQPTKQSIR